jgi:hypothetical protein
MKFAAAADELRRREIARLADAVTPTLEGLRSLTPPPFRAQIALMMERLGHTIVTDPAAPDLVTTKAGRKFVTACAVPTDLAPTAARDLKRLHEAVIAANAEGGIFVTPRGFTPGAEEFARTLPMIRLVDGPVLMRSMNRSMKGAALPAMYKSMCRQCGGIVEHSLSNGEAVPCANGHQVPPSIARASLAPRKLPVAGAFDPAPKPVAQPLTRRAIRAHNYRVRGRLIKKTRRQQGG